VPFNGSSSRRICASWMITAAKPGYPPNLDEVVIVQLQFWLLVRVPSAAFLPRKPLLLLPLADDSQNMTICGWSGAGPIPGLARSKW
jgi:hypothetical protein